MAKIVNNDDGRAQSLKLADGRLLAFAEFGDPAGKPVLFFHGGNDSRLEGALLDETAQKMAIWLIAPDRPGYGLSTYQPGRQLADWPKDVIQLSDALGLKSFGLIGHSGGGPHVAVVAYHLPHKLSGAALVSSAAPPGSSNSGLHPMFRVVNFAMARSGWLHRTITEQTNQRLLNDTDKFFAQWGRASKADGQLFRSRPATRDLIASEMKEALRQGSAPILHEHKLYTRPWGFRLANITVPVQIWHGLDDGQASPAWSQYLADRIPDSETHFVPDEGHFSLLVNYQTEILKSVITKTPAK